MKRKNILWISLLVIAVIAILLIPRLFFFNRGFSMHNNYGMMGGWMFLGLIIPAGILVLIIAAGVWLGNKFTNHDKNRLTVPAAPEVVAQTCPNCSKTTAADWNTCPYCGTDLKKSA